MIRLLCLVICLMFTLRASGQTRTFKQLSQSSLFELRVIRKNATTLVFGSSCSATKPCLVRVGAQLYTFTSSSSITLTSGTGLAYIYISRAGALTVSHDVQLSCSGCTPIAEAPSIPADAIPLFSWTATDGAWDANGGSDLRSSFSTAPAVIAGIGTVVTRSATTTQVSVDTTAVPTFVTASASIMYYFFYPHFCSDLNMPFAGAKVGEAVIPVWPVDMPATLLGNMLVTTPGQVTVRLCNVSANNLPVNPMQFGAMIIRSF